MTQVFFFLGGIFTSLILLGIFSYLYTKYRKSKEKLVLKKHKGGRYLLEVYTNKNSFKSCTNLTEREVLKKLLPYNPNTFISVVDYTGKIENTCAFDFVSYLRKKIKSSKKRETHNKIKLKEVKKEQKPA